MLTNFMGQMDHEMLWNVLRWFCHILQISTLLHFLCHSFLMLVSFGGFPHLTSNDLLNFLLWKLALHEQLLWESKIPENGWLMNLFLLHVIQSSMDLKPNRNPENWTKENKNKLWQTTANNTEKSTEKIHTFQQNWLSNPQGGFPLQGLSWNGLCHSLDVPAAKPVMVPDFSVPYCPRVTNKILFFFTKIFNFMHSSIRLLW